MNVVQVLQIVLLEQYVKTFWEVIYAQKKLERSVQQDISLLEFDASVSETLSRYLLRAVLLPYKMESRSLCCASHLGKFI